MDVHAHITRRLALLPDDKLMHLMNAMKDADGASSSGRDVPRTERLAVLSQELRARGIFGPPWWSGAQR